MQAFRFRSFNSDSFCWLCDATQGGPLRYTDFTETAPHRSTLIDHQAYVLSCAASGTQPSFLFRCPGLCLHHVAVDSMHSGDLGVFQDAVGSLFHLEVHNKVWHRTRHEGLAWLNTELGKYYKAHRQLTKITPLVLSQLVSRGFGGTGGYPTLKSKAAQCRHVADFALVLAYMHRDGTTAREPFRFRHAHRLQGKVAEHTGLLVRMFEGLVAYHRSCAEVPFVADRCREAMYAFLQALGALNTLWREGIAGDSLSTAPFRLRPKAHMLQHLVADQLPVWGSPAGFWCYGDEDFVGKVKVVASRTKHPRTLEVRVMEKLMIRTNLG